jgi:pyridoxine kinase
VKLVDVASTQRALRVLHDEHRVPNVVVSSMPDGASAWTGFPDAARPARSDASDTSVLACLCSSSGGPVHAASVPLIPGYFSGVGDLFSALVLAHFTSSPNVPAPLAAAASAALTKTHAVLARTHAYVSALPIDERNDTDEEADMRDPSRRVARMRARELRIVQSRDLLSSTEAGVAAMVPWVDFWTTPV